MLSKRALSLKPSPTLALAAKAKELKAAGKDVISLSVGEPDWDTFDVIKEEGIKAIREGHTKYTPASGLPELRTAIAQQTSADLKLAYTNDQVTVSTGGKFILFSAFQVLLDPGDEVIVPAPYWVSYPTMVELAGGVPVVVTCGKDENFKLTPSLLEKVLSKKTKLVLLNSPSNPTGEVYSAEELAALAKVLKDYPDVIVVSDDIYNRLVFNDNGLAPHILHVEPQLENRVLVVNGVSKTYSMTGWRIGWAVGPKEIVAAMGKYQSQSVSSACTISQKAAIAAIEKGQPDLVESKKLLKTRRDFAFERLTKMDGVNVDEPQGAFYIWPQIESFFGKSFKGEPCENSNQFCDLLLKHFNVAAVPGREFGLEGYLRISYALEQERMAEAFDRLEKFLSEFD